MFGEGDKDWPPAGSRKTYSRSVSWSDRSPRKSNISRPQGNSKSRACLPPLQPLSITRPSPEEWPRAGSDDLGVWPNPPTPGVRPPTPGAKLASIITRENSRSEQAQRDFEFQKDKLAFFNKECSRIVDHIYLGSDTVAKNREVLHKNGITHVLNCVGFSCPEYFKDDLVYKTLWLQDSPTEDITSILYDVFDYFEDVREQGGRVFVHCCQGVSRSTSLVIAYLMWKDGQSFEDAFQHVKAARGVTNPNMGFACQLLQCQKRVHAMPASPTSVLRIYRMAPHSPYDPLHLVPKMLSEPGAQVLDSRGAFIIHVPSAIYVWIGKHCSSVMADNARAAAFQVIRYEKAQGPPLIFREGQELSEFWDALGSGSIFTDGCVKVETMEFDQRKVDEYDMDFEIFEKALAGGVVPPFPLSGAGSETCLPARENGWSRLRRKLASGIMKEFITSSRLNYNITQTSHGLDTVDTCNEISPADPSSPSAPHRDSPDSFSSYATSSPPWIKDVSKEVDNLPSLTDPMLSPTPSFSSLDSFSSFLVDKQKSNSTSPSLSPSTSDYSSSFTFSPSSSNWSEYFSAQLSPSRLESKDHCSSRNTYLEERAQLLCKESATSPEEAHSASHVFSALNDCSPIRWTSTSLAERRGSSPPSRMKLPSVDEASQLPANLVRSWSFSLPDLDDNMMRDIEYQKQERPVEIKREEQMLDDPILNDTEFHCVPDEGEYKTSDLPSNDATNREAEVANLVFYEWPSMHKVELHNGLLDSRSVYMIVVSDVSLGTINPDILYIWIGRDFPSKPSQFISNSFCEDDYILWDTVGRNFLIQKGLDLNSLIQVVKEDEEPKELLKHLPCFSFQRKLGCGVN